jgi:hypothetical protein
MTQSHSVPDPSGSEHRVKPTALALHVASAAAWGRPWRRRALSLPAPRALTFQGIPLPLQPLRSWLHLLSRAGMLGVRPPAVNVLRRPEDDEEDTPARIEDLGFELATEMILDFANFARQSRLHAAAEQLSPETESASVDEPSAMAPSAGIDELHALGMAGSVSSESVDQDFLKVAASEAQEGLEAASVPQEPVAVDEPQVVPTADAPDIPVLADRPEQAAEQAVENDESPETSSLEALAPAELTADSVVELSRQEVPLDERPQMEAPVVTIEMKPELEPAAEAAEPAPEAMAAPEAIVQPRGIDEPAEQRRSQTMGSAQEPETEVPEVEAESEIGIEPEPESMLEAPKTPAPAIVVSGVRIARKPVVRVQPSAEQEPAVRIVERLPGEDASEPLVETAIEQSLAERIAAPDAPEEVMPETITASAPISEEITVQPQPEIADAPTQPERESAAAVVMHWEPVEPDQQAEVIEPVQELAVADEFGFEPMIASLEDALAVLAAANAVHEEAPAVQVEQIATASPAQAVAAPQADDSNPEAAALQGIFIQKETEMSETRDESIEADAQSTAPITSVELQEVAATLSVPQLEADPDDVLSDVQSTLNSLAGMAQGLTQQKQAAGRLQEELDEWNVQLQERERLASDKEERLQQLENHLKEAKTNLDRMAAENNRLLAERSEALKELAQTVDLRDKTTLKRAESIQLEQQRIDEQAASLRHRASELDERESALKRKSEELGVRLKQLQSAKDKFSTIVKSFNETVQFNSTLSAISKTVNE